MYLLTSKKVNSGEQILLFLKIFQILVYNVIVFGIIKYLFIEIYLYNVNKQLNYTIISTEVECGYKINIVTSTSEYIIKINIYDNVPMKML